MPFQSSNPTLSEAALRNWRLKVVGNLSNLAPDLNAWFADFPKSVFAQLKPIMPSKPAFRYVLKKLLRAASRSNAEAADLVIRVAIGFPNRSNEAISTTRGVRPAVRIPPS